VTPAGVTFTTIEVHQGTTVALDSSGHIWAWGMNASGQVGNGTTTNVLTPTDVTPAPDITTGPFMPVTPGTNNDVDVDLQTLQPGDSTSVLVSATFSQAAFAQVVTNQAYVDASNTPIAGLLSQNGFSQQTPTPPTSPAVADYNSLGVTGNLTCNTNVDTALASDGSVNKATGYTTDATEDSCDQVPALLPAYTVAPSLGNLTGQTWYDENKDGIEQAPTSDTSGEYMVSGVTVTLTQTQTGGSTTTNPVNLPSTATPLVLTTTTSNGHDGKLDCNGNQLGVGEYAFCSIPIGAYKVQFGISADVTPASPAGSYAFTKQTSSQVVATVPPTNMNSSGLSLSLPAQSTGLTADERVYLDGTTTNVNAGLISSTAAITVVKDSSTAAYSDHDNTATPDLPVNPSTGKSDSVPVSFTFTNTGDDTLTNISWTDTTVDGPAVTWTTCSGSISGSSWTVVDYISGTTASSLAPGGVVTCTGTLPAMAAASHHADSVKVTAQGAFSHTIVTANDPWSAAVPLSVDIEKLAKNASDQWGPMAGSVWQISTTRNGDAAPGVSIVLDPTVTTDNAWKVSGLQPNVDYWLTETSAPQGYSLLATPIEFSVNAGGWITLLSGQGSGLDTVATSQTGTGGTVGAVSGLQGVSVLSVRDVPSMTLPFTGGSGMLFFNRVVSVLIVLALAAIAWWFVEQKRRRGEFQTL
jgi:hypothetical protein